MGFLTTEGGVRLTTEGDVALTTEAGVAGAAINPYQVALLAHDPVLLLLDTFAGGEWKDESGNDHHGTIVGATVETVDTPAPSVPAVMAFAGGSSHRVEVPDHADLDITGAHTVVAFVKRTADTGDWNAIWSKGDLHGYQARRSGTAATMRYDLRSSATSTFIVSATGDYDLDVWRMWAWRFDPSAAAGERERIFREDNTGTMAATGTGGSRTAALGTNNFDFAVGAQLETSGAYSPRRFHYGLIGGLAIIPSALTLAQIQALYDAAQEEPVTAVPVAVDADMRWGLAALATTGADVRWAARAAGGVGADVRWQVRAPLEVPVLVAEGHSGPARAAGSWSAIDGATGYYVERERWGGAGDPP